MQLAFLYLPCSNANGPARNLNEIDCFNAADSYLGLTSFLVKLGNRPLHKYDSLVARP